MASSQLFRHQIIEEKGVVSGALVHFRNGRAPGTVFTDPAMRIPGKNPMKANGRGVVIAYLPVDADYEVTVTKPDGSFLEQFTSTSLPMPTATANDDGSTTLQSTYTAADAVITSTNASAQTEIEPLIVTKEVKVRDPEQEKELAETKAKLEEALEALAKAEAVKDKLDAREVEAKPEEPPAEIADLFESDAYGMEAERLFKLHTDLTSKIVGNMPVTDAERALHSRLTPHVPWLKSRGAVEVL